MNNRSVGSKSRKRVLILFLLGLGAVTLTCILVDTGRDIVAERHVIIALQSTNQAGAVTAEGIEI